MTRWGLLAAVAAIALVSSGPASAETEALVDLVRKLNSYQDAMARGVSTARGAIPGQVEKIQAAISTLEADSWKERANARAVATFLLCGGSPRAIRRVAEARLFDEKDAALIDGALAYAEGRAKEAAQLLTPIDPKTQPVTLGGHLALIRGGLLIGADNARARELLDLARLLMPSSLVEEAALRREISIVDPLADTDKFLVLARRYVAQYSKSPFAKNFWDELRAATTRVAQNVTPERLSDFLTLFDGMPAATRFDLYTSIAHEALVHARTHLAAAQTERAAALADSRPGRARIALYRAALTALDGDFEEAAKQFAELDSKGLGPRDLELREIVSASVERIQAPLDSAAEKAISTRVETPAERDALRALADSETVLSKASGK
jgi:chemotaxis protein MotC